MKRILSVLVIIAIMVSAACFFTSKEHVSFAEAKAQSNLSLPLSDRDYVSIEEVTQKVRMLRDLRDNPECLAKFLYDHGSIDKYIDRAETKRSKHKKPNYRLDTLDFIKLSIYFYDDGELWQEAYMDAKESLASMYFDSNGSGIEPTPVIKNGLAGEICSGHIDEPQ